MHSNSFPTGRTSGWWEALASGVRCGLPNLLSSTDIDHLIDHIGLTLHWNLKKHLSEGTQNVTCIQCYKWSMSMITVKRDWIKITYRLKAGRYFLKGENWKSDGFDLHAPVELVASLSGAVKWLFLWDSDRFMLNLMLCDSKCHG